MANPKSYCPNVGNYTLFERIMKILETQENMVIFPAQASPPTSPTLEPTNPSPLYLAASAEAAVALLPEQLPEKKKEEEQVVEEEQTGSSRTTTIAANSAASVAKDSCTVVLGGSGGPVIPV